MPKQDNQQLTQLSKFLSYVLRHRPQSIGVTLDSQGWASIEAIMAGAAHHGPTTTREMIERAVATNDKKRFAISADGLHIRAVQGHSNTAVAIDFEAQVPPTHLYHGTATRFLSSILGQGLVAGNRHHVHLSADPQVAADVGARHGTPVVLTIAAADMHAQGHPFYRSDNGVWLTPAVPAMFLGQHSQAA